jgi:hypothetical protein
MRDELGGEKVTGRDLVARVRAADPHCGYIHVTTVKVAGLTGGR